MSRGGHNWKGGGTVEGTRSLDVMKLARAGYLSGGVRQLAMDIRGRNNARVSTSGR